MDATDRGIGMLVKVQHVPLFKAVAELRQLATDVETGSSRVLTAVPDQVPVTMTVGAHVEWMREQSEELESVAALGLLLDTQGLGAVTFETPGDQWDVDAMFDSVVAQRFGPDFQESTGLADEQFIDLMLTFGSVGQELPEGSGIMSADELQALIIATPSLARALTTLSPRAGTGPEGQLYGLTTDFVTAPGGAGAVLEQRRLDARNLFEGLGAEQASVLAMMFPSTVSSMHGVPFENLADANRVRIVVALEDEQGNLSELEGQHEHNQHDWDFLGLNNNDLDGDIDTSGELIELYQSILDDDRQILSFDPSGDGAMAELHGPIGADTGNVGVIVPGTTAELSNFDSNAKRSRSFAENNTDGDLSMITWMGGDLPDSVVKDAPFASYAESLGPGLADFSHDVRLEVERAGASRDARITYAGHSYGGAVVGLSELHGLDADRVLHVESAGMGHDVHGPGDLPASQIGVDRYSMTAPGDPIALSQGTQVGDNVGHGADPDDFDGTTRLHTGDKVDGSPNTGSDAHGGVFEQGSDAWNNMYEVFTGGTVQTYQSPHYDHVYTTYGGYTRQGGWNDDGQRIDIE